MGFEELKFLNSDFLNEPLNYLNYIDSLEKYGENSYLFDGVSRRILIELLSKSTLLFSHEKIRPIILNKLTVDDLYYLFKNNKKLGECLNSLFGDAIFSSGDFNNVCEYMNMTAIQSLPNKFLSAFSNVLTEKLESEDNLDWVNTRFGLDLSSYETFENAILNSEAWKLIIQNGPLMCCVTTTDWFISKVIQPAKVRIWRTSDNKYYDDAGIQYDGETGEPTGSSIPTDTLELMKTTGLVTEDFLIIYDSAYQRIKDALYWLVQNQYISLIMGNKELISIFLEDENCCQYLVDNAESVMNTAFKDAEFARQVLTSNLLLDKIIASDPATKVFATFINDVQVSYDALSTINDSLALIPANSGKIYESVPIQKDVQDVLTSVNEVMTKIHSCQNYTNLTEDNITTFMHDPEMTGKMLSNTLFVKWAAGFEALSREIVKNSVTAGALSSDARTYDIALSNPVFVTALFNDDSLYESIWISDEDKKNVIYNNENAMEMFGNNDEYTRRFINHHLTYEDSTYNSLANNFSDSTWVTSATNNEFLMDFMCHNLACANLMVDSVNAMNAVYDNSFYDHFETEMMYQAMIRHGDVGFVKWLLKKSGLTNPSYKTYANFTAYVASMTNGTICLAGFKEAIDKYPELVTHVLGDSNYLMEILFDPSKIKQYNVFNGNTGSDRISISNCPVSSNPTAFLSMFSSIKKPFKENNLFIGNILYFITRLLLELHSINWGPTVVLGNSSSQQTIHKDFSEWTSDDFIAFHSWRTLYYYHVNGKCELLKDWLYNSNIFMTKYILYLLDKNINLYSSLEEICNDDTLFNELIHSDTACNMAFYSPLFMKIVGESRKNLNAMYLNYSQVQKNISVTSNQDQLNNFVSAANVLRKSSLCIHKEWINSESDPTQNVFTSTDFQTIDNRKCLIVGIYNVSGTNAYGYCLDTTHEPSVSGTNAEVNILKFAKYLELKAPGSIKYVDYIPLED